MTTETLMLHHGNAPAYTLHHGDALQVLKTLPSESVHVCVTSPPYYGLRSYLDNGHEDKRLEVGTEDTPDAYVSRLVDVFREVRRVLHKTGVAFINLGDSYAGSGGAGGDYSQGGLKQGQPPYKSKFRLGNDMGGIKAKDLIGIPWMVAFALRADGWYLRSEIIWHKKAPMPESVQDRPTKAHEQVFLLAKSASYFYDATAIAEPFADERMGNPGAYKWSYANDPATGRGVRGNGGPSTKLQAEGWNADGSKTGRNRRSVWTLGPEPYAEAHFATMPTKLVEPCILAGSSAHGCCSKCGAPWERVTEKGGGMTAEDLGIDGSEKYTPSISPISGGQGGQARKSKMSGAIHAAWKAEHPDRHLGWQPTCTCQADVIPCTVLDPFVGSGTTLAVALKHGRSAIGIDLNANYIDLAHDRIGRTQPLLLDIT